MPQYDDSFLDSPKFRRRTRSYTVQKQFLPKSKSFHITTTPLLLAVTNHARTLSGSLSTYNLKEKLLTNFIGQCHMQTTAPSFSVGAFPILMCQPAGNIQRGVGCHGTLGRLLIPEIYRINLLVHI
ncbi:hypothetical protein ALC60_03446 [Trachymyrmex zeteki]|uniref:Uncharacterized protein n=1 Tax=Mycetomoellerius zeteki TaxID=64791 RepID=A0A151XAV7_9HYME|nr:hypothetical protein ALC60_03446 [Trachymyrmex zeteki]